MKDIFDPSLPQDWAQLVFALCIAGVLVSNAPPKIKIVAVGLFFVFLLVITLNAIA